MTSPFLPDKSSKSKSLRGNGILVVPRLLMPLALVLLLLVLRFPGWYPDRYRKADHDNECPTSCNGDHGTCLVDRCICHPSYQGDLCDVPRHVPSCQDDDTKFDDRCMNTPHFGRLQVSSMTRYRAANGCEVSFWEQTAVPQRNQAQLEAFDHFRGLPTDLGHVLEMGAGPYTKARLILEQGKVQQQQQQQQQRTLKTATLMDPLSNEYMTNPKIQCSYKNGTLCIDGSIGCIPTLVAATVGETPLPEKSYDTIIMVNTIEHAANAIQIFDNIYRSLKPGGIFVFGEEYILPRELESTDECHPIRITPEFYMFYLNQYFEPIMKPTKGEDTGMSREHEGALKSIYAIVQKPI